MHKKFFLFSLLIPAYFFSHAQTKKFDTTVKMGDAGYRVQCNNKNVDQNEVTVDPVNLKTNSSKPSFIIYGKATRALIDDFNDDGLPDVVICVLNESNNTVINPPNMEWVMPR